MTTQLHDSAPMNATGTNLDAFPDAVLIVDQDGLLIEQNKTAMKLFGIAVNQKNEVDVSRLLRFGTQSPLSFNDVLESQPGTSIPCTALGVINRRLEARLGAAHGAPTSPRWILSIRDTTNRESEEQRYRESVKMEAVKALAMNVGNDFNNVLAALSGRIETACHHLPHEAPEALAELQHARADLKRAARVIRTLQRVSRTTKGRRQPVDSHSLISESVAAVQRECKPDTTFLTDLCRDNVELTIDLQQIGDVLVSLLQNARDATPSGGTITIRTSVLNAGPDDPVPADRQHQEFLRIDVVDEGRGIPSEIMPKIFEPFFTTKTHEGAGLGLAGVYDALKSHEGGIAVESGVGTGTTFSVYLPSSRKAPSSDDARKSREPKDETILVIDDEVSVRNILRKALQRSGYHVLEASDGDEGIEILSSKQDDIDLVILDIVMPRVSGWDVLKHLRGTEDSPPVIVQSGYVADEGQEESMDADAFLGKPYDLVDLTTLVRRVLDGSIDE